MGQKSNTLTLRSNLKKNLSFLNYDKDLKTFLEGFNFLNFIEKFLNKKNILVTKKELNFVNNRYNLDLGLFYKTIKLTNYKKRSLKVTSTSKVLIKNKVGKSLPLSALFLKKFLTLKNNLVLLNIYLINSQVNESLLKNIYQKTSRFMNILFLRKFSLFIDFLKISALFYQKKIFVSTFLYILGQIFRVLPKRKHSRFLFFLKFIFQLFVNEFSEKNFGVKSKIKGIKFVINGKLQGKTRASTSCIQIGAVPIQSISENIEFSKLHVYTIYGAFGFKIWVCR